MVADALICGDEKAVWADAAYDTHARRARLKSEGKKARIARRANKHHPELAPRLKRYNRLIARRRAAIETTFATLKNRMRLTRIRYVGLVKASAQIMLAAIAFNTSGSVGAGPGGQPTFIPGGSFGQPRNNLDYQVPRSYGFNFGFNF